MDKDKFEALEVKTTKSGWYWVTLYHFSKLDEKDPDYFQDWMEFDGEKWLYGYYEGNSLVCFIHNAENT